MKVWLEIVYVFVGCFLIALISVVHGFSNVRFLWHSSAATPLLEELAKYEIFAPFWLFPLAAVLQYQAYHTAVGTARGLISAMLFVATPFLGWAGLALIEERQLRRKAKALKKPRPPTRI